MTKTFKELVKPWSNNYTTWYESMDTEDVIKLLKQVRQATLEEAAEKADTYGKATTRGHMIVVDKDTILDLDKESIEVNE